MPISFEAFPLKLFSKGQDLAWDPRQFDLTQDREDWLTLNKGEQDVLLRTVVGFLIGERAVAHDLAPLQQALRCEKGRMEEEMYITQQTMEESVHVAFFQRWMNEVLPDELGSERVPFPPMNANVRPLLGVDLPEAMQALNDDKSPETQLKASVMYHMMVEGVLAEFGYQFFYKSAGARGIFPGLLEGVRHIQRDEARHIAFGNYFIQRLLNDHPHLEELFLSEMERLRPTVVANSMAFFNQYEQDTPFGLNREEFGALAEDLVDSRIRVVQRREIAAGV